MKRILASTFLKYTTDELFDFLEGEFICVFPDGEIVTNDREIKYSSFAWDFMRMFPKTKLLLKHHVQSVLKGKRLGSKTHLQILGLAAWSVHDAYYGEVHPSRDLLAKMIYEKTNLMYNELSYRLEEYVVSLDALDFINVMDHPVISKAMDELQPTQASIDTAYESITGVLNDKKELVNNPIAHLVKSGLANKNQVLQCIGPRGFVTDVDSHYFPNPIMRGYAHGFRSLYDSLIESRSAAKSLFFSKTPLQAAEYFSRRLQLLCQTVKNLHHGDCGSTKYLNWKIRAPIVEDGKTIFQGDLVRLEGKYYLDEETQKLKPVRVSDTFLIGRTIKIRSVIAGCSHNDPYGVCSVCFGEMSYSIPENTNIGHACATYMTEQSSQSVLSVKHLDGLSAPDAINLDQETMGYLKVSNAGSAYLFSEKLKGKNINLVVSAQNASGLTDVDIVKDITELNITRISEIDNITLEIIDENGIKNLIPLMISIGRRKGSLTYNFLSFIKEKRWTTNDNGHYVFNIKGWDFSKEFITLPLKHFNMADHSGIENLS